MPGFVKDEGAWEKAKRASKKAGNKKGTTPFWKFANYMYFKITGQKKQSKNESWSTGGVFGTQVPGYGTNGPSAYPKLASPQAGQTKKHGEPSDHEEGNMASFRTWFDDIEKTSQSDRMLTRPEKNKFDTTKERQTIPGSKKSVFPKKDKVTVWGAPKDFNYIRN